MLVTTSTLVLALLLWLGAPQPPILTPASPQAIVAALRAAHVSVMGREPSTRRLAMAWAHVALECGQGRLIIDWNIGNIGAPKPWPPYYRKGGSRFRAYVDLNDGARGYWLTMRSRTRALACFDAGDPECAAYALEGNYHRADPEIYARGMHGLFDSVLASRALSLSLDKTLRE